MPKARNLRFTIGTVGVTDRNLHDLQIEFRGAEDEIEISEGIEIPEIGAARFEPNIVAPAQNLGPAQCIGKALREQPREDDREKLVGDEVEEAHCLIFHPIDQTRAIDELALAGADCPPETRQLFGWHSQI